MDSSQTIGFAHFIAQTDSIGRFLLAVLLVMSLITWVVTINKGVGQWLSARRSGRFLLHFHNIRSPLELATDPAIGAPRDVYARLARHIVQASHHAQAHGSVANAEVFIQRALHRAMDSEAHHAENGLTALASIGSTAPFVGLFGTVWGVYHALVNIGMSGQGTLDKVAGPVGEALIMTALGLAVAIPAVLAYNLFVRRNRNQRAQLNAYAHELLTLVTTGAPIANLTLHAGTSAHASGASNTAAVA